MVELTRARGIDARLGDVQSLEFGDEDFDLVVAAWVLFHPSDLDRALSEIVRVLRRGGRLIAATNSVQHLQELWALVGVERTEYSFSAERGDAALRRHFATVVAQPVKGWVTFNDTATARDFVASSIIFSHLADQVPELPAPLRARKRNAIFVATKA
jgi:ubiquinone/menaquinone biosynthesis C-methylase UbiE